MAKEAVMWKYLKMHEAFIHEALEGKYGKVSLSQLQAFHNKQVLYLQHERLVHLVVTMFTATFFLLSLGFILESFSWRGSAVCALLMVLLVGYLMHYFRLENGVQRLYHLSNSINREQGVLSANYEGKELEVYMPAGPGADAASESEESS